MWLTLSSPVSWAGLGILAPGPWHFGNEAWLEGVIWDLPQEGPEKVQSPQP